MTILSHLFRKHNLLRFINLSYVEMKIANYFSLQRIPPVIMSVRTGRFLAPGAYPIPFSKRFDEEGNRRPPPHPETPKFRGKYFGLSVYFLFLIQYCILA